jgi:hypothetical protein
MSTRWLACVGALALALAGFPTTANAVRIGVGVDVAKISVDQTLTPGGTYDLPTIGVINTGDLVATYTVGIRFVSSQRELKPGDKWFAYDPAEFVLKPRERARVGIELSVPETATAGSYFVLLAAQPALPDAPTKVGPAAATKLTFRVGDKPAPTGSGFGSSGSGVDWSRWLVWGAAAACAVVLVWLVRRLASKYRLVRKE